MGLLAWTSPALGQTSPVLENTSWQLVAIHSVNGSVFRPLDPQAHLLRFRMANRLQIEADCNQAGATWTRNDTSLVLTDLVTTRKLCLAPSLFNRFILNLLRTESMQLEENKLILHTDLASDWMEFEPFEFIPGVSN